MKQKISIVGLAAVLFCACQCHDLPNAWAHSPFDHLGWLAFMLWIFPLVLAALSEKIRRVSDGLLIGAAVFSLLGVAADFNLLLHVGLAVSLIAFMPGRRAFFIPWACAAVAWMPVLGWLCSPLGTHSIGLIRIATAGAAALWACGAMRINTASPSCSLA